LGEVLVAHIMTFTSKDKGQDSINRKAKTLIDSLYQRIKKGDDFGVLASKYSMDKGSSVKNGELPWFGTGRMVPEFETAAFALKDKGDVSEPIQSAYGWHILKLIDKKGLAPYDEIKADLERKVKRDERANRGQQAFLAKSRLDNNYKENAASVQEFVKLLTKRTLSDSTFNAEVAKLDKPLFSFAGKNYTQADFAKFLKKNSATDKSIASEIIKDKLDACADAELLAYEDSQLEKKYDDFRNLMQEYHDGILLFEVSNREVWDKASKDTKGLDKYFKAHKDVYKWEKPHFKGRVILCKDKETLEAAKNIVKKSAQDSIDKYLRVRLNDSIQHVKVEKGLWVQGDNKVVDNQIFKSSDKFEPAKDYPYSFVVGKMLQNKPEDYTDVRGLVTADYQEFLEKEWIKALRAKYPVKVDDAILKTVKKN
jgi:peptidyl-prolyl cis-trans isomerase SurA